MKTNNIRKKFTNGKDDGHDGHGEGAAAAAAAAGGGTYEDEKEEQKHFLFSIGVFKKVSFPSGVDHVRNGVPIVILSEIIHGKHNSDNFRW